MEIKIIIRNRTITKCFSSYEKRIFDVITMFYIIVLFPSFEYKCLISFDLSEEKFRKGLSLANESPLLLDFINKSQIAL